MHNSFEGSATVTGQPTSSTYAYLLKGTDSSSLCLHCHEAAGMPVPRVHFVSTSAADMATGTAPVQLGPAGDFGWLKKSYSWSPAPGAAPLTSPGERHGHNIVAVEYGYLADGTHGVAPGGTYPSASFACTSCHDPHGKFRRMAGGITAATGAPIIESGSYADSPDPVIGIWAVGVYRLLGGVGYQPKSLPSGFAFTSGAPDAVSPRLYNRAENVTQTRVAYGRGMSEWCANCHPGMMRNGYTADMGGLYHPAGNEAKLSPGYQTNYIAYVKTGDIGNRDATRSYLSLVPFEEGTSSYSTLKMHARSDDSYLAGPDAQSNVSCISCHRAHASGFDAGTRFRVGNSFITVSNGSGIPIWPDPATSPAEAQGRTAAETQRAYYGRLASTFAPFQSSLCNKCHVKD